MIGQQTLSNIDHLLILTIGNKGDKDVKIQRIILILSKLLNTKIDAEPRYFEGYAIEAPSTPSLLPETLKGNVIFSEIDTLSNFRCYIEV